MWLISAGTDFPGHEATMNISTCKWNTVISHTSIFVQFCIMITVAQVPIYTRDKSRESLKEILWSKVSFWKKLMKHWPALNCWLFNVLQNVLIQPLNNTCIHTLSLAVQEHFISCTFIRENLESFSIKISLLKNWQNHALGKPDKESLLNCKSPCAKMFPTGLDKAIPIFWIRANPCQPAKCQIMLTVP